MLVYVIHKQRFFSLTLPLNVYGSYSVTDIDENNKERMLINISEQDGKWVAFSNKRVSIWQDNQKFDSVFLENYQYLLLQIKGQEEFLVMYCCPVNDDSMVTVSVSDNTTFSVGRSNHSAIACNNPLISDPHVNFYYQNNIWKIENLDTKYGTFVNDNVVMKSAQLLHGDVVFIMGLKLIVLGNTLTFNDPLGSVKYDNNIFHDAIPKEDNPTIQFNDENIEIKLYEEKDYFVRSPRFMEVIEEEPFKIEGHPSIGEPDDTPALLTVGPMLTMGMTSVAMLSSSLISYQNGGRNFVTVVPTLIMSFSMLSGTLLWPTLNRSFQKKKMKKKTAKIENEYGKYLIEKETELINLSNMQKQILLSNNISSADCYKLIINRSKSLWMRELSQKDFLTLRLGIGEVPLKIKFNYPEEHFQLDPDNLDDRMREIVDKHKNIKDAPIILSLVEKNILAIVGKDEFTKNYMDLLMLQIIALHSYYDLKIVLFTTKTKLEGWNYLKQLPHLFKNDKQMRFFATNFDEGKEISQYLQTVLKQREEFRKKNTNSQSVFYKSMTPYYLIITDDYQSFKNYSFCDELLELEHNLGFSLVILNSSLANLPTQCKSFIGLNSIDKGGIFERELKKDTRNSFTIEYGTNIDFLTCVNILSNIPIENKDDEFALPKMIGFLEMFDAGNVEQLNALERWTNNNPIISLEAPIGVSTSGNLFKLDLHEKEAGPHGLIAGMTGSGKSEFIITYILSMAINYHPNEVQFVLIDYKGGGLVGAFENKEAGIKLPHLAGTITNLDVAEINRALASIESELKRRQKLFNEAREKLNEGTIDIYKYQKYYRERLLDTPISHLFIISDEFAELKSQQPQFMEQLISTARIGRSLGVHLILATQKPSGVVNDQIWSNSRFKVCLKVQDANDSNEVIKRPDAASLKEVGRFYLQVGYDELFLMGQSAYSGIPYIAHDKVKHEIDDKISFINHIGKSIKTIDVPKLNVQEAKGEELSNIVKYLDLIAKKENVIVPQLWLEKLATFITVDELKRKYHFTKKAFEFEAVIGEYDNPSSQNQGLLTMDLTHKGNAVIYSIGEKNTIINSIIYSLISTYHTKELNLYIMDFDSQTLKIWKDAPQVGDVVFSNESEKVNKLLKMLMVQLEYRKKIFEKYNGSYDFYIKHSNEPLPGVAFIIHGYENFKEMYEDEETILNKICREGAKYGIYTIITAISDRSLRLNTRNSFTQIIPLKLNSAIDYNMLLGKKVPTIPDSANRGIALINDEPYEFQTASVCDNDQLIDFIKKMIPLLDSQIQERASEIKILPEKVSWSDIFNGIFDLKKLPIGLETESLNISSYDVTKALVNLFTAADIGGLIKFAKGFIKNLINMPNIIIEVLDYKKTISKDNSKKFNDIKDLIFDINRTKKMLVFITGMNDFIKDLPEESKNDLANYFKNIHESYNCYFILVEKIDDIRIYVYEQWFKQLITIDTSIFIGRGLGTSSIHNLATPLRVLNQPIPENFGYNIKDGNAVKIKVLEEDSD